MRRKFTCIICPNGCEIDADYEEGKDGVVVRSIEGQSCKKGAEYVKQELIDPRRTISSSVLVRGGELPLASVRLTAPIPKARIFDAMREIKNLAVDAPVEAGTILVENFLALGTNLVITKSVAKTREAAILC